MSEQVQERPVQADEAAETKSRMHPAQAAPATKTWHFANFANPNAALTFVNAQPAQGAGEISANARNDGTVGLFYFL